MIHEDKVFGKPLEQYTDTKANIEALTGISVGAVAYATNTDELGSYNGASWSWGITATSGSDAWGSNLVKNSPGQIVTDGAEPQWWDDVTNATITDEDAAGETIPEKSERVFKVVTTADDVYGYQTFTFSDESLLDAGQTTLSFGCWVYCASASKASIGIYGTNLTLQESSQHSGDSTWEWLAIENKTLHASDTSIEVRLIVDTGTAYFCMPMLTAGSVPRSWMVRNTQYVPITIITVLDMNTTGDVGWSSEDVTPETSPLCTHVHVRAAISEADGASTSYALVGHAVLAADSDALQASVQIVGPTFNHISRISCDDSQQLRYTVEEVDADNDVRFRIRLIGYWRWE